MGTYPDFVLFFPLHFGLGFFAPFDFGFFATFDFGFFATFDFGFFAPFDLEFFDTLATTGAGVGRGDGCIVGDFWKLKFHRMRAGL